MFSIMFNVELETIIIPEKMVGKNIKDYNAAYIAYDSKSGLEIYCVLDDETNSLELVTVRDNKITKE